MVIVGHKLLENGDTGEEYILENGDSEEQYLLENDGSIGELFLFWGLEERKEAGTTDRWRRIALDEEHKVFVLDLPRKRVQD